MSRKSRRAIREHATGSLLTRTEVTHVSRAIRDRQTHELRVSELRDLSWALLSRFAHAHHPLNRHLQSTVLPSGPR